MVMSNGRKRRWSMSAESTDFSLWKFMFPLIDLIQSFMDFLLGDAHICFPLHCPVKAGFLTSIFSPRQFCLKIWFYLKEHLGGTEYRPLQFFTPNIDCLNFWLGSGSDFSFIMSWCPGSLLTFPHSCFPSLSDFFFLFFYSALPPVPKIVLSTPY